jgi:hypothetical protein
VNTTLQHAALAGRASVRASLENWTGAMADAAGVPADFVYEIEYFTTTNNDWNQMAESNLNSPHRSSTVWNTFYENNTDPRTPWRTVPDQPFGGPAPEGQIPWMPPAKYFSSEGLSASRSLPIPVSSGREMDLLRAENELINGDFGAALAILNARRAALNPVQPDLTASDLTEAWTVFKRERGIELWLEGRRLGDMRRWRAAGRPGPDEDMTDRSLCFPIPTGERNTNPNL